MKIIFEDRAMLISGTAKTVLLIADIHLGYHIEMEHRIGAVFPPQHQEILERIRRLIDKYNVQTTYILGDLKHSIGADESYNWEAIPEFIKRLQRSSDLVIIPGNHDGDLYALLPRQTSIADIHGIMVTEEPPYIAALHGHAWPSEQALAANILVIGHNHPSIGITRVARTHSQVPIRRSAGSLPAIIKTRLEKNCVRQHIGADKIQDDPVGTLIVLPSFNTLASGNRINRPDMTLQGPLFERGCAETHTAEVYSIDNVYLGTIESLVESTK
ncbi:MAG: metallophosphoesterase [Candidatus Thorarchaeota archaeon]|nr:metallophosphoesterase [Candidatus Thorarchaeota archaeon]